jgi:hypothetical protein
MTVGKSRAKQNPGIPYWLASKLGNCSSGSDRFTKKQAIWQPIFEFFWAKMVFRRAKQFCLFPLLIDLFHIF